MGMDEKEEQVQNENVGTTEPAPKSEDGEPKSSRLDAAKAFFRAVYAGEEPQPGSAGSELCRNCQSLTCALNEAEQKTAELDSLYKRLAADFDNYRRRLEREKDEAISCGVRQAVAGILPALDDLDRAMLYLTADTTTEKLIESIKLIATRIFSCLEQIGIKRINAIGELFDPHYHEPVQQIETNEHADGTVMSELRRGYIQNDKVVRPALVNVASNISGEIISPAAPASTHESHKKSKACKKPVAASSETIVENDKEAIAGAEPVSDEHGGKIYNLDDLPEDK